MGCEHLDFEAHVEVSRIIPDGSHNDDLAAFVADVEIKCRECGEAFGFRGCWPGMSWSSPTRRIDGTKISLPLLSPTELELMGPLAGACKDPPPAPMPGLGFEISTGE